MRKYLIEIAPNNRTKELLNFHEWLWENFDRETFEVLYAIWKPSDGSSFHRITYEAKYVAFDNEADALAFKLQWG